MDYSELKELLSAVATVDELLGLQMLLEHHSTAHDIWLATEAKQTVE